MAEQVVVVNTKQTQNNPCQLQSVSSGKHLESFVQFQKEKSGLNDEGAMNLRNSAIHILNHCNPHDAVNNLPTTHLVVGYVQSGKTMSFTSLIELALDCKYRVVIILAGVTTNLLSQTNDRLQEDLICGETSNNRFFKLHKNPESNQASEIVRNLKMKDTIVVINVLKNYERINRLAELFDNANLKEALKNETVLIIDDEADQASLNSYGRYNSKNTNTHKESSTYAEIIGLRNKLIGNSYIQYTATPQANILINALDSLSPKTHTLLQPGKGYCGGKLFFGIGEPGKRFGNKLIKIIPDKEVVKRKNAIIDIPNSLEEALMLHVWSVILTIKHFNVPGIAQLSMMVHVVVELISNQELFKLIEEKLSDWCTILEKPSNNIQRFSLMAKFQKMFEEAITCYDKPQELQFEELSEYILDVLYDTHVYLITSETDDVHTLNWDSHCSNILVGAQMLNRGFTVKNLATTYMPRHSTTVTNADTIEQRCRFFGYKEKYIKSCRVYLPQVSVDNYVNYIQSEEELRTMLASTESLKECGHKIMSFPKLRPTRANILPQNTVNLQLFKWKEFSPYQNYLKHNLDLVNTLLHSHAADIKPFQADNYKYEDYTNYRAHTCFRVSVDETISFLESFQFTAVNDISRAADTKRYLQFLKEQGTIKDVLFVNIGEDSIKERSLDGNFEVTSSIFAGPSSSTDKSNYPGDKGIHDNDTITIQFHRLHFTAPHTGEAIGLGIYYPPKLKASYISTE